MAVASAAKMVLLFGSLLGSWRQVVSPFWKWRFMTAAAPTLSLILDPSVQTTSCGPRALWYSWNLAGASSLVITNLLTPSMRLCLSGSYSCVPGGKLGQTISASISAEARAPSTLRPTGWVGGRAAYRYVTYIENRFLRLNRYIVSEVSVSIKISKGKYFATRVDFLPELPSNQHLDNSNILTTAQETFKLWHAWW